MADDNNAFVASEPGERSSLVKDTNNSDDSAHEEDQTDEKTDTDTQSQRTVLKTGASEEEEGEEEQTVSGEQDGGKTEKPDEALLSNTNGDTVINIPETTKRADTEEKQSSKAPGGSCLGNSNACLRRNEYFVLILGSLTFLLGCIVLAIGVYMMQVKSACSSGANQHKNGDSNITNIPGSDTELFYRGPLDDLPSNSTDPLYETSAAKPVNLAEGHPAYQSSTYNKDGSSYPAELAVDGVNNYMFSKGSCARTDTESRPYWYVDLGKPELVKTVQLIIPRDLPAGELHNFEIRIGQEDDLNLNPVCRYFMGTALVFTITVKCERIMYGRYISVEVLGDETRPNNRLTLCEVKAFNG